MSIVVPGTQIPMFIYSRVLSTILATRFRIARSDFSGCKKFRFLCESLLLDVGHNF